MRKILAAAVATGALVAVVPAAPQPANAFALGVHGDVTEQALPFLTPAVLDDIRDEHAYEDTVHQFDLAHHFDACTFSGGAAVINDQYLRSGGAQRGVIAEFQPGAPGVFGAADEFGQLLHQAQDFYAHSNWVEIGRQDLVDDGLGSWPGLGSWSPLRPGVVVGEGRQLPAGWTADNAENPLVPTVTDAAGQTSKVLISGTVPTSDGECLSQLAVGHWGSPGLHKDEPGRPNHEAARELGLRQTQHEWCRALHLAKDSAGGYAAASVPMGLWVDPGGYPHPGGSRCAGPRHGQYTVTVALDSVRVRDDSDPFGNGEINLNLVAYRDDFTDSARRHAGPVSLSSGSQVPGGTLGSLPVTLSCVSDPAQVVTTVQGWDDDGGSNAVLDDATIDPDDVLTGLTVRAPGGEGTSQVSAASGHLEATFRVTSTRDQNCG
jgi:hypothetical protein